MAISIEQAVEILRAFRDFLGKPSGTFLYTKDNLIAALDCFTAYYTDGTTAIWTGNKQYTFEEVENDTTEST